MSHPKRFQRLYGSLLRDSREPYRYTNWNLTKECVIV